MNKYIFQDGLRCVFHSSENDIVAAFILCYNESFEGQDSKT